VSASTSCAVFPTTEAAAPPAPRRERLRGNTLTVLAGLGAALPVIVTTIRALADGWLPAADQGIIATRAYDAFTTHTPLVGQFSMASGVTGHTTYDPGPMLYWLLALPARFGGPPALTVTMGLFNTAAILASVALARRRGGLLLMFAAATGIALMSHSFGSEALHGIWNPSAGLFALTLLCFLCWSVACGEARLLPAAVLVASFAVQCHLAYVPPALGLLALAAAGLAFSFMPRGRGTEANATPKGIRRRRLVWSLLAALVVAAVCWSAPIADQLTHSPGNLGVLASAATTHQTTEGASAGWHALAAAVGIPPRWPSAPRRRVTDPHGRQVGALSGGDYGDTRLAEVWSAPGRVRTISCLLALCGLVAMAAIGVRLGRRELAAGAAIGLVLCAAFAWLTSATPVQDVNTLGYTLWWGSVLGMWVWLMLLWSLAMLVRARTPLERRQRVTAHAADGRGTWAPPRARTFLATVSLLVVAGCGAAVAATAPADAHEPEFRSLRAISASLARSLPRGSTVLLTQHGLAAVPLEPTVKYALRRDDVRALGTGAALRLGSWYQAEGHRYAFVIDLSEGAEPGLRGAVLARVGLQSAPWLPGADGPHLLTVSLAAVPPGASALHRP
jgi:hypothetical protein